MSRGDKIRIAVLIVLFVAIYFRYGRGQTVVSPEQVGRSVTVVEWWKCDASGTSPEGAVWDCRGIEFMRFRMADGTTRAYHLIDAGPNFAPDEKWKPQPLK